MIKACKKILAGVLVLAMTVGTWLPATANAEEPDASVQEDTNYAPSMEGNIFYAKGIPVTITSIPDKNEKDGALVSWAAGKSEDSATTWEAGSMEIASDTIVYGGGYEGTYEETSITMDGGTVGAVYGGGVHDTVTSTSVVLNGGTVTGEVFGGGEYTAVKNTSVEITASGKKDASGTEVPAVVTGGIYLGNASDANVSQKATVVVKNGKNPENSIWTKDWNISTHYEKKVTENGQEVIAKAGNIGDSAEAVLMFEDYDGEFLGNLSEDFDLITVAEGTNEKEMHITLPENLKEKLGSKIGSSVITFATSSEDSKELPETPEDPADVKDEKVQGKDTMGEPLMEGDYLYVHDLYPDAAVANRMIAHFYKVDPTGEAGTEQPDKQTLEMTKYEGDTFMVLLPDESYEYVQFDYVDENGYEGHIRMTYKFRGAEEPNTQDKEYVRYQPGEKDCIFIGKKGQRSFIDAHISRAVELLDYQVIYFNMQGSGYKTFNDGNESYLKLYYGDGENDFYKVTKKASMNEDCFSFVFPGDGIVTTATKLRLVDARINEVGQATEAETRFYYSMKTEDDMMTPANLMNTEPFWSVYHAKQEGDTVTVYFNNFLTAFNEPKIQFYEEGWLGGRWTSKPMTKVPDQPNTYSYEVSREYLESHGIRFTGESSAEDGGTYTSEELTIPDTYDYPCWYANYVKGSDTFWKDGELQGNWDTMYSVNRRGDNGVSIDQGIFTPENDVYYATADFYDYYSDDELTGLTPPGSYNREGDVLNQALNQYYKKQTIDKKGAIYFGAGGSNELHNSLAGGLYGYDPNENRSNWITAKGQTIATGIADDTLTENGEMKQGGQPSPLFDRAWLRGVNDYRTALGQVYSNVSFPFTMNEEGYWEYDSLKPEDALVLKKDVQSGYYLERTNRGVLNSDNSGNGFFPFDDGNKVTNGKNFMFGTKMSIPFSLTADKQILDGNGEKKDIEFKFSGDDDVWIFIDGKLVLDLGGIHNQADATINFQDGTVSFAQGWTSGVDEQTAAERAEYIKGLEPNTQHTLTMFYMERGLNASNLKVTFNFLQSAQLEVANNVTIPEQIDPVFDEALSYLGGFQYELSNQAVSGKSTPVDESAGYVTAGKNSPIPVNRVEGNGEKIAMSQQDNQVHYTNTFDIALDPGTNNQDAIDQRLGTIHTDLAAQDYAYLRMEVNSSNASQGGASLYVALKDKSGNRIGGWANTATYESNSNSIYPHSWSVVRIDLRKLKQIEGNNFSYNEIQQIQVGFRNASTIEFRNLAVYEAMKQQPTTGFQVSLDQISDYGSVDSQKVEPMNGAAYEHYDSKQDENGKITTVEEGAFSLADGQRAVFTDKIRFGSYVALNQKQVDADDAKIFDTSWTLTEGGQEVAPGYLTSNRADVTTVKNGAVNDLSDISGTKVSDGRISIVDGTEKPVTGTDSAFVYRNYTEPDDTVTTPIDLRVSYENVLRYGSVTVEKRLDVTNCTSEQIKSYENSSYEFRLNFTDVAGHALENQIGDGSALTATLMVQVGNKTQEIDGKTYLVGTATFDGIPAGTTYEIKEVQQDGVKVTKVAQGENTGGDSHIVKEIQSPDNENIGDPTDEEAHATGVAYASGQTYIFTNERRDSFDITAKKDWRTESGTNEKGESEVDLWLQRSTDGGKTWEDVKKPEGHTNPDGHEGEERYIIRTFEQTATFSNLASIIGEKSCTYRVREYTVDGYTPIYSVETDGTLVVSNIPTDEVLYVQSGKFTSLREYVENAANISGLTSAVTIKDIKGNDQTNNTELFKVTYEETGKGLKDIEYQAPSTGYERYTFTFTFQGENTGETQEASADVLIYAYGMQDDIYVLDYGLPANLADQKSKDNLFANDTFVLDDNTESVYKIKAGEDTTQQSGDFTIEDASGQYQMDTTSAIYKPKKFMDSVDEFTYTTTIYGDGNAEVASVDPTNGVEMTGNIKVMPADVVYYEDTFKGENPDGTGGIYYGGSYEVATGSGQAPDNPMQSIDQDDPYGYDEIYNGEANDSLGSGMQINAKDQIGEGEECSGYAIFTFTGTGFDVVGRTDKNTTKIMYTIADTKTNKMVKMGIVDGAYEGDEQGGNSLYQLPVIRETGLDKGTYKVMLQLFCKSTVPGKEGYFILDGIRIYNPLNDGDTGDYLEEEKNTTVESVRDMVLGTSSLADQGILDLTKIPDGAKAGLMKNDGTSTKLTALGATVTEVKGDGSDDTNALEDYLVSGPKNEIYLPAGNAVAFVAEADQNVADKTMQIEAKTVNTSGTGAESMLKNVGDQQQQEIPINSKTAMYYELDMSLCKHISGNKYLVILTNTGANDISLTNLKYKGYALSYPSEDLYETPEIVTIDKEASEKMDVALKKIYESIGSSVNEKVAVKSAYFANLSVKAGDTVYLDVTLKDDEKSFVPVLYYYDPVSGELKDITTDAEYVDQDTLKPVRSYTKQAGGVENTYQVFKMKVTAKDFTEKAYFVVGASNGSEYCTMENTVKTAIKVEGIPGEGGMSEEEEMPVTPGIPAVPYQPEETKNSTEASGVVPRELPDSAETSGEVSEESTSETREQAAEQLKKNKEAGAVKHSKKISQKQGENGAQEVPREDTQEESGLLEKIVQGIQIFFTNIYKAVTSFF